MDIHEAAESDCLFSAAGLEALMAILIAIPGAVASEAGKRPAMHYAKRLKRKGNDFDAANASGASVWVELPAAEETTVTGFESSTQLPKDTTAHRLGHSTPSPRRSGTPTPPYATKKAASAETRPSIADITDIDTNPEIWALTHAPTEVAATGPKQRGFAWQI